jgi:hypothetical protein
MSKAPFEQQLVSMVTSLIHLRAIGEELRKKAFVSDRMRSSMPTTVRAFDGLTGAFGDTEAALQHDAQPYIQKWLSALGFLEGGECRFEVSQGHTARVRGRFLSARLWPRLIDAKRCICLVLEDPDYALDGGGYAQFDSFNAAEQVGLELVTDGSRCERAVVNDAAGRRHVAHVVVPIWRDDYDALARAKFDCLRPV